MFERDDAYTLQGQHQTGFRETMLTNMMTCCISLMPALVSALNARTLVGISNRLMHCVLEICLHCWYRLLNHDDCSEFFRRVTPRART